jgi:hypothetical protein
VRLSGFALLYLCGFCYLVSFTFCLPVAWLVFAPVLTRQQGGQLLLVPQNRGMFARLYPGKYSPAPAVRVVILTRTAHAGFGKAKVKATRSKKITL